jgi:hypothetical protein
MKAEIKKQDSVVATLEASGFAIDELNVVVFDLTGNAAGTLRLHQGYVARVIETPYAVEIGVERNVKFMQVPAGEGFSDNAEK